MPLEDEPDHPHVYWSVPKHWFPGGVVFTGEEVQPLLRLLTRMPKSAVRDRLLAKILASAPRGDVRPPEHVIPPAKSTTEETYLGVLEDSTTKRVALRMRYLSAHRAAAEHRQPRSSASSSGRRRGSWRSAIGAGR